MSSNLELIESAYDAYARGDLEALFRLFAHDIVVMQSTDVPWGGNYRGHAGAREFTAKLLHHIDTQITVERMIDAGGHVVAIGRTHGTVRTTGRSFDVAIAHVWEVHEGLINRVFFHIDLPAMRDALGLP